MNFSKYLLILVAFCILITPRKVRAQSSISDVGDQVKLGIGLGAAVVIGSYCLIDFVIKRKNSIRKKKLVSVDLSSDNKPLTVVNEGSICSIDILAIDKKGRLP